MAQAGKKASPDQLLLFNEAECEAAVEDEPTATVAAHSHKRGHRNALSKDLPRIDVSHDLSYAEKICACGHEKSCIGEETSEQLEIIPAQIRVIRNIFPKCACNHCDDAGVQRANPPLNPIPRSNVTPGLLAYIVVSKFMDALPLYRQEKIFNRLGAIISRTTMARWIIRVLSLVQPLLNLMSDPIKSYDILGIDETPVQALKEPGKTPQSKSYMFVRQGGSPDKRIIFFDSSPSKAQPVVDQLLAGFDGYLQRSILLFVLLNKNTESLSIVSFLKSTSPRS